MEIDAPINNEKEAHSVKKESSEARTSDATMTELDETLNDLKQKMTMAMKDVVGAWKKTKKK